MQLGILLENLILRYIQPLKRKSTVLTHLQQSVPQARTLYYITSHHTRTFPCFNRVTRLDMYNSGFGSQYSMFDVLGNEVLSLHLFPIRRTVHEPHQIRLVNKKKILEWLKQTLPNYSNQNFMNKDLSPKIHVTI